MIVAFRFIFLLLNHSYLFISQKISMGCVSGTTQKQRLPNNPHQTGNPSLEKNSYQPVASETLNVNNYESKKVEIRQQNLYPKIENRVQPTKNEPVSSLQNHQNIASEPTHEIIDTVGGMNKDLINKADQQKKVENLSNTINSAVGADEIVNDGKLVSAGKKKQTSAIVEQHLYKVEHQTHEIERVENAIKQMRDTEDEDLVHNEGPTNFTPPVRNLNFNIQFG